jgi:uncharacterized protein (DUF1810 family)
MPADNGNSDPFDLQRFVTAQAGTFDRALEELRLGQKTTHWIWFIFPQMRGLGRSPMAQHYGIGSLDEARAYLAHTLLGPRLIAATRVMLSHHGRTLLDILGSPDDMKFRSSMTLFAEAANPGSLFEQALYAFCGGQGDPETRALITKNR